MWERIILWCNKVACINVVTPRQAVSSFIDALADADIDGNGELSIKELLKLMKTNLKGLASRKQYDDDTLMNKLGSLLK